MKLSRRDFLRRLAEISAASGVASLVKFEPPEEKIEEDLTPYPIKHGLVIKNIWDQPDPYLVRYSVSNVVPSYGKFDHEAYVVMRCSYCGGQNLVAYNREEVCWKCGQPL